MAFDLDIEGMVFEAARDGAGAQGSASAPGRERAVAPTLTEDDLERLTNEFFEKKGKINPKNSLCFRAGTQIH